MGSEYTKLLFHAEVCWLPHGKVFTCLFELWHKVMLLLHHCKLMTECMISIGSQHWHTQLMFSVLSIPWLWHCKGRWSPSSISLNKNTRWASQFQTLTKRVWQPCGHCIRWDTEDSLTDRGLTDFGSISNLNNLSWLTLLWNYWCCFQPSTTVKLDFPPLLIWNKAAQLDQCALWYETETLKCGARHCFTHGPEKTHHHSYL